MTTPAAAAPRSVVVAGGAGAVGSMLVALWRGSGAAVTVVDAANGSDIRCPGTEFVDLVRGSDVVVLAVPEPVALTAVGAVSALLRPGSVLVETLSVKTRFAAAVADAGVPVPVVGINPMFAPSLGLPGRPVAVVLHRPGPAADTVVTELRTWGARVYRTTTDRHDRAAAAMQALTHAAVLSFGLALGELGVDGEETAALAPPPFTVASALLARITGGTPEVYRDVQTANPYAPAAREALARAVTRLTDTCEHGTEDGFADLLAAAGASLDGRAERSAALCASIFDGLTP